MFVLENGFTVYLNEDKTANEVYGAVVVKAGSKNDPADVTGIAHYLEHLMFKGTTDMGTTDYQKEKPYLDSITIYYDLLDKTKDEPGRKKIQQLINNQSVQASKYGLPTEFDKLLNSLGGSRSNAFTQEDMTFFISKFPADQVEKWLELFSHRFQNPVFRSFQSELEVIYEEKNRSLDDFQTSLSEEMFKHLFKYHPYGTQTVLGTTEHLKNPSLTKMYDFFSRYYIASNMALVLCGNYDTEKTLPVIREKFSQLRTGKVLQVPKSPETVFSKKEVLKVRWTPVKVTVLGYKTSPDLHPDKAALEVFTNLLFNGDGTGKIDKLQHASKFMSTGCYNISLNDDGAVIFFIVPKFPGQSFNAAEKLFFDEIGKIKNGDVSEKDLKIAKLALYRQRQQDLESLDSRTFSIVQTFGEGSTWQEFLKYDKHIEEITREDVISVAKKYFGDNYFAIHSKMGFPKKETINKPGFKPVTTDQKGESSYAKKFKHSLANTTPPKFLDFETDTKLIQLNESNQLYVTVNPVNDIFTLKVTYSVGKDSIKNLDLTSRLFTSFHTEEIPLDSLKEKVAVLGLKYSSECDAQRFSIMFTGLRQNLQKSLLLINKIINECEVDEDAVKSLQNEIISERKISEKEPGEGGKALYEYARLGRTSSFLARLSSQQLKKLTAGELLAAYKNAITVNAVWHYVGTESSDNIKQLLSANLTLANNKKEMPLTVKPNSTVPANVIYLLDDKKAVQSQIYFIVNSSEYISSSRLDATFSAFNQYMAGVKTGLMFQEIREYRSLAYGVQGGFVTPQINNYPAYFRAVMSCQADKTNETIETMYGLIHNMPQHPERMDEIISLLKNSETSKYPGFRSISSTIENLRERGYTSDPLKEEFSMYDVLTFNDIMDFYTTWIKNKPVIITIYGNKSKMDLSQLAKYGKIVKLKKKDIILE
jgi:zinc protease